MLMDISSEMVHSLLPLFILNVLGASALTIGVVEGLGEATALIVKVFSGTLSDYLGQRKGLAVFGYTLVAHTAPADLRGTAFGFFNVVSGVALLLASVLAGWLWDQFGAAATFQAGAVLAGVALCGVMSVRHARI